MQKNERDFIFIKKKKLRKNQLENRFKLIRERHANFFCMYIHVYLDASAKIHLPSAKRSRHSRDVER